MLCTALRIAALAAIGLGLFLFAGAAAAASAMPSQGLDLQTNPQAAAMMAGIVSILIGWTGFFCRH